MVLAGLHLHHAARNREVLDEAMETLDWVLSFQDTNSGSDSFGAITMGEGQPLDISTEANADALAAAWGFAEALGGEKDQKYREAARRIAGWLARCWKEDRFAVAFTRHRGALVPVLWPEWLDSQTWTLLSLDATREGAHSLDPRDYNGLRFLSDYEVEVPYRGKTLRGFAKLTPGAPAFWSEGVAGYVLAARVVGMPEERFLEGLEAAREPDGTLLHIIGIEKSNDWREHLPVKAIDGTLWATWADPRVNFNPFRVGGFGAPRPSVRALEPAEVKRRLEEVRRRIDELEEQRERAREVKEKLRELRRGFRGTKE
jgi:hypothetical protein